MDASAADVVAVKGNQLDVDGRLYLGGVPRAHDARRINVRCARQPKQKRHGDGTPACPSQVTTSLGGCVRSVSLNGLALDLSRPASQRDVASCFTEEETGSYFNGSGYAALSEWPGQSASASAPVSTHSHVRAFVCVCSVRDGYKVGSDVSVSLDFRTSQSEGVFLGISSAKVDAIGLEMIKGQVRGGGGGRRALYDILGTARPPPIFVPGLTRRWCLTSITGRAECGLLLAVRCCATDAGTAWWPGRANTP